jgi:hypothetical protein
MGKMVRVPSEVSRFAKEKNRRVVAMLVTTKAGSTMETVGSVKLEDVDKACRLLGILSKLCDKG